MLEDLEYCGTGPAGLDFGRGDQLQTAQRKNGGLLSHLLPAVKLKVAGTLCAGGLTCSHLTQTVISDNLLLGQLHCQRQCGPSVFGSLAYPIFGVLVGSDRLQCVSPGGGHTRGSDGLHAAITHSSTE